MRRLVTALSFAAVLSTAACGLGGGAGADPSGGATEADTAAPSPSRPAVTGQSPPTKVSPDGHDLVTADGSRFVWVADTAWFLTQRLTREEVEQYLDTRVEQGFTTIQMVGVAAMDGEFGETANRYGDLPYDGDFGALSTTDGNDPADETAYDYWDHVEFAVRAAHERGLTVALLPAWSRVHAGVTLRPEHGHAYGRFLAERLRDVPVVWVMGGDDIEPHADLWKQLTAGVREVDPDGLLTYHPAGWQSSLGRLEKADFTMVQTSHCEHVKDGYPPLIEQTLAAKPDAPIVDAEPLYEDHPWCWDVAQGYSTPEQTRAQQWWSLFAGGFGVTYGHHSVWQFNDTDGREAINAPRPTWKDALSSPAAEQMRHLRTFIASMPTPSPRPDAGVLASGTGEGWDRALAVRSEDGRYVAVYLPTPREVAVDPAKVSGDRFAVRWFDPRSGASVDADPIGRDALARLSPPDDAGDWVLSLTAA